MIPKGVDMPILSDDEFERISERFIYNNFCRSAININESARDLYKTLKAVSQTEIGSLVLRRIA